MTTKTLADYTPEQRATMIGMWCDLETNQGTQQVVLYRMIEDHTTGPVAVRLSFTSRHELCGFDPKDLTPRFDLPRVWTPDGKPVPGEWAKGHVHIEEEGRSIECQTTGDLEIHYWGEPSRVPSGVWDTETARRFITDWEVDL